MGAGQSRRSVRDGLARPRRNAVPEDTLIALLLALTQIVVAGLPAALLLDRGEAPSRFRLAGNAFLFGTGIAALTLLGMSTAGIAWTRLNVAAAMLVITIALWIAAGRRASRPPAPGILPGTTWLDVAPIILLTTHALLVTRRAVGEWDFWAIWGLKARVFFERGAIDWAFLREPLNSFQHPDYPPLMPLSYVFVAIHDGGWNDRWLGLLTTLFALAAVLVARDVFARELSPAPAALATLGVAAIAATPWIGMAEAPMIAYGASGLLLVRQGTMPAGAVLLGLAACSKNEGLALIAAAGGALLVAGRWRDVVRLWPAALLAAPWMFLRAYHGIRSDYQAEGFDLARIGQVLGTIVKHSPERPLLWAGMAVALAVFVRDLKRERFLLTVVVLQVLFYVGAYLVTPYNVEWHIRHSWPRLLDHVAVPLAFVTFTILGARVKEGGCLAR